MLWMRPIRGYVKEGTRAVGHEWRSHIQGNDGDQLTISWKKHRHDLSGVPAIMSASSADGSSQHNISCSGIVERAYEITFLGRLLSTLPLDSRDSWSIMLGALLDEIELAVMLVCTRLARK